jgi:cell volume regulation protein A
VAAGVPDSQRLFDLVFVLVVIFTLIQAPTLPRVARRLGLSEGMKTVGLDVESSPLGAQGADVLEAHVGPNSRLHGVEIFELRLPEGSNVTLVLRDGEALVPTSRTMLRHGDDLIVVASERVRDVTEDRLRTVSEGGKLATWHSVEPPEAMARRHSAAAAPGLLRRLRPGGRASAPIARRRRSL